MLVKVRELEKMRDAAGYGLRFALGGPQNQLGATLLPSGLTVGALAALLDAVMVRSNQSPNAVRGQRGAELVCPDG